MNHDNKYYNQQKVLSFWNCSLDNEWGGWFCRLKRLFSLLHINELCFTVALTIWNYKFYPGYVPGKSPWLLFPCPQNQWRSHPRQLWRVALDEIRECSLCSSALSFLWLKSDSGRSPLELNETYSLNVTPKERKEYRSATVFRNHGWITYMPLM